MKNKTLINFFTFVLLVLLPVGIKADTNVTSPITENTTWTKEQGPYIVDGSIDVVLGKALSIDTGTRIYFTSGSSLNIFGDLKVEGSVDDPVYMDMSDPLNQKWWINFFESNESTLKNIRAKGVRNVSLFDSEVDVENFDSREAEKGFRLFYSSRVDISNYIFEGESDALALYDASSASFLDGSIETSGGGSGSFGIALFDKSLLHLFNVNFKFLFTKGVGVFDSTLYMKRANFSGGTDSALEAYASTGLTSVASVDKTNIKNMSDTGVQNYNANLTVTNSKIENNNRGIDTYFYLSSTGSLVVSRSSVSGNGDGVRVYDSATNGIRKVDIKNNWWGSASGPFHIGNTVSLGDSVFGTKNFKPWLLSPENSSEKVPVIIIPGIMGSYLNKNDKKGTEVWPSAGNLLLNKDDGQLDVLLDLKNLFTKGVLKKTLFANYFADLEESLGLNGFKEKDSLFFFGYDWRQDVDNLAWKGVSSTTKTLAEYINEVRVKTGSEKVDIVAHSMGGLLVKSYLNHFGEENNNIRKFIDIATPHLGSPFAPKTLIFGDNIGSDLLGKDVVSPKKIKEISQNFPSIYALIPSKNYYDDRYTDYKHVIRDVLDIDNNQVTGELNYAGTKNLLQNTGRNSGLLESAEKLHDTLDTLDPKNYVDEVVNIVGCGTPTLGNISIRNKKENGEYEYDLAFIDGDGTVPLMSAEAISAGAVYYIKEAEHATMPSRNGVKELVGNILTNSEIGILGGVSTSTAVCGIPKGKVVSVHSPVDIHIYDREGRHSGPDKKGDIQNDIPGIAYETVEDNKFVFIPDDGEYEVKMVGTDEGTFNVRVSDVENGETTKTDYFYNLPVHGDDTKAELDLEGESVLTIVDTVGATTTVELTPVASLDQAMLLDQHTPTTTISLVGDKSLFGAYVGPVSVTLNSVDGESGLLQSEYSFDGTSWQKYTNEVVIETDGTHVFYYRSVDKVGNIEKVKQEIIGIDLNAPMFGFDADFEGRVIKVFPVDVSSTTVSTSTKIYGTKVKYQTTLYQFTDVFGKQSSIEIRFYPPVLNKRSIDIIAINGVPLLKNYGREVLNVGVDKKTGDDTSHSKSFKYGTDSISISYSVKKNQTVILYTSNGKRVKREVLTGKINKYFVINNDNKLILR